MKRPWMLPLTPLYAAAAAAHGLAYRSGLVRPRALRAPVISVGSLSAGGAGKTPVVMMLARLMKQQGAAVAVLSRGYGRAGREAEAVDPAVREAAARFGDEPVEMASAGLRVYVGRDRYAAGVLAEDAITDRPLLHLLDDGFQHRRLARTVDVVLLTEADVRDRLLPAGDLREPLRALARADVVILREDEADELTPSVRARTRAEIWRIRRRMLLPELDGKPLLFSGIARPEALRAMLRDASVSLAGHLDLPDHHVYTLDDMVTIETRALRTGAAGFLTTAKDAVKLTSALRERLERYGPVRTVGLEVSLDQASQESLTRRLAALGTRGT